MSERQRLSHGQAALLGVAVCLALYVLSIGPVGYLVTHHYVPPRYSGYVWVFYAPVIAVGMSCEPCQTIYGWYMDLWHVGMGP